MRCVCFGCRAPPRRVGRSGTSPTADAEGGTSDLLPVAGHEFDDLTQAAVDGVFREAFFHALPSHPSIILPVMAGLRGLCCQCSRVSFIVGDKMPARLKQLAAMDFCRWKDILEHGATARHRLVKRRRVTAAVGRGIQHEPIAGLHRSRLSWGEQRTVCLRNLETGIVLESGQQARPGPVGTMDAEVGDLPAEKHSIDSVFIWNAAPGTGSRQRTAAPRGRASLKPGRWAPQVRRCRRTRRKRRWRPWSCARNPGTGYSESVRRNDILPECAGFSRIPSFRMNRADKACDDRRTWLR